MSWIDAFLNAYNTVQSNGAALPQRSVLNLTTGATVTDDSANRRTNASFSGGGGSGTPLATPNTLVLRDGAAAAAFGGLTSPEVISTGDLTLSSASPFSTILEADLVTIRRTTSGADSIYFAIDPAIDTGIVFAEALPEVLLLHAQRSGTGAHAGSVMAFHAQDGQDVSGGTNNAGGVVRIEPGQPGGGGSGGANGWIELGDPVRIASTGYIRAPHPANWSDVLLACKQASSGNYKLISVATDDLTLGDVVLDTATVAAATGITLSVAAASTIDAGTLYYAARGSSLDDWPRLFDPSTGLATAAAAAGRKFVLRAGAWRCATTENVGSGTDLAAEPGVIVTSTLTPAGSFPGEYIIYVDAPAALQTGTLAATPAIGATTLSVALTTKPVVGHYLQILHGVSAALYRVVTSPSGSSPWTVTIDRPTTQPWTSAAGGDTIEEYATRPSDVTIAGGTWTGTGDQYIEVARAQSVAIRDLITGYRGVANDIPKSAMHGFDLGCVDCLTEDCSVDLTSSGASLGLNGFYAQSNDYTTFRRCYVTAAYSAGISLLDCYASRIEDCHATVGGIGFAISSLGVGPDGKTSFGCFDCSIVGCSADASTTGIAVGYVGPATGSLVQGCAAVACTAYGITVGNGSGTQPNATRIVACDVRNSDVGLLVYAGCIGTQVSGFKADCVTVGISSAADIDITGVESSMNTNAHGCLEFSGTNTWRIRGAKLTNAHGSGYGIYVTGAGRLEIDGCTIDGACAVGLYVNAGAYVVLKNFRVSAASQGIFVDASATVIIGDGCDLTGCTTALTGTVANVVGSWSERTKAAADALATDATAETEVHRANIRPLRVLRAYYLPDAALTANDTNFATIKIWKRDASGGTQTAVASKTTKITGGSGNWTAFVPVDLGTITNAVVAAGWTLTFEITKTTGGVSIPSGRLVVDWVYA